MKRKICLLLFVYLRVFLYGEFEANIVSELLYITDDGGINCSSFYEKFHQEKLTLELENSICDIKNLSVVSPQVDVLLESGVMCFGNCSFCFSFDSGSFIRQIGMNTSYLSFNTNSASVFLTKFSAGFDFIGIGFSLLCKRNLLVKVDLLDGSLRGFDFCENKIFYGENYSVLLRLGKNIDFGNDSLRFDVGVFTGAGKINGDVRLLDVIFYRDRISFEGDEQHLILLCSTGYKKCCKFGVYSFGVSVVWLPVMKLSFSYMEDRQFLGKSELDGGTIKISFSNSFVCMPEVGFEKEIAVKDGRGKVYFYKKAVIPFGTSTEKIELQKELKTFILSGISVGVAFYFD